MVSGVPGAQASGCAAVLVQPWLSGAGFLWYYFDELHGRVVGACGAVIVFGSGLSVLVFRGDGFGFGWGAGLGL